MLAPRAGAGGLLLLQRHCHLVTGRRRIHHTFACPLKLVHTTAA